jgi:probable addiction module antidote protein
MATKTKPFDVTKFLDDDETIAAFLTDALDTGNPAYINRAFGDVARARGMTDIAKQTGVKREALYRALSETGNPQLTTMMQVIKAMGLRLSVVPR